MISNTQNKGLPLSAIAAETVQEQFKRETVYLAERTTKGTGQVFSQWDSDTPPQPEWEGLIEEFPATAKKKTFFLHI